MKLLDIIKELQINNPISYPKYDKIEYEFKLADILAKLNFSPELYELYNNDITTFENIMFQIPYDKLYEPDISEEEYNNLYKKFEDEIDTSLAYLIRNFTIGDDEQSRHNDEKGLDIKNFMERYDVNYENAYIINLLINGNKL